ncbi:MAG: Deoxyguanosine kinase [Candidatus Aerophobetes bacterium ADurb.Bin490]|nr:MAG: Deoxyguanosine kinase [Candidatus Aerophobetes bacterium ADurb.Bin490]HPI02637.1 deoxynucleoside kinase [Candidatus Goldiibacteriota bacterium]HPN64971.1 deoxynucleoside kinase [Candidatus Goldiibacteriota bacterium]HRQ43879.1 deoxynucleoside kinase [Candidatus Goldiibacteriota bacterium]
MNRFHYIAVEGVLGAGKTTFSKMLAEDLKAKAVLEQVDNNPFLEKFYKDMGGYAFQTQLFFLINRIKQQEPLKQMDLFDSGIVADYILDKDRLFAYVTLEENELALYEKIHKAVVDEGSLLKPDLVIYLQASVETLMERIKKRGRKYEKTINKDYISELSEAYNYFFSHFPRTTPLVIVNTDEVDFVNDRKAYELIRDYVLNIKGGINYYTPRMR